MSDLLWRVSRTSINVAGLGALLFIGSLLSLYVWNLTQDPLNWVWVLATLLFGWMFAMIARVVTKGRRFYCYDCDSYEIFFRRKGEWRCHMCGEATAL